MSSNVAPALVNPAPWNTNVAALDSTPRLPKDARALDANAPAAEPQVVEILTGSEPDELPSVSQLTLTAKDGVATASDGASKSAETAWQNMTMHRWGMLNGIVSFGIRLDPFVAETAERTRLPGVSDC
ncbi:MAG: hypothetical protein WD971_05895 [Pirellulales bacterium]